MEFTDRTVLVTGGGGRLGREIALEFSRAGAKVGVLDQLSSAAESSVAAIRAVGGVAEPLIADITSVEQVEAAADAHERLLGPIDVLVNAAGIYPNRPVLEMDDAEWDRVFAVNTRGPMFCCRAVARRMVRRGTRGAIVNISSAAATSARAGGAHYCGSKAAVNLFTHVLAIELGPYGIRVNAIAPGMVLDKVLRPGDRHELEYVELSVKMEPLGRTGAPSDIAPAAVFLASDRSGWTTGAILEITGGSHTGRPHVPLSPNIR